MRKLLLGVALALLAGSAQASNDTITVTVTTVAAPCTAGCTRVLNGPTSVNLVPLVVAAYQQPCNVSINGTCTTAQVFTYFIGLIGTNLKNDIQAAQTAAAVATAQSSITPVPVQ